MWLAKLKYPKNWLVFMPLHISSLDNFMRLLIVFSIYLLCEQFLIWTFLIGCLIARSFSGLLIYLFIPSILRQFHRHRCIHPPRTPSVIYNGHVYAEKQLNPSVVLAYESLTLMSMDRLRFRCRRQTVTQYDWYTLAAQCTMKTRYRTANKPILLQINQRKWSNDLNLICL